MKISIVLAAALALVFVSAASAQDHRSNTRTNICKSGFCADVTQETITSRNQRFTAVRLHSWPSSTHRNLRCQDGRQVEGSSIRCTGRSVLVQACKKPLIGRSKCGSWVSFS
jgi:hypothetical protein